ncbi:MAG TPA: tyrosine-type recombinase/integrase [Gaiellaceae bacterium]|jgi:integrase|nr:tyrosine-type recombinase/integrase [Gaiellaceae bacterium]
MPASDSKRERHIPQARAQHIYWTRRADGSKVFEVRDRNRKYHVVGPRLDEAKAEARRIYDEGAPTIKRAGLMLDDAYESWKQAREIRPSTAGLLDRIYDCHIRPKLGRRKLREIDRNVIASWLARLERQDGREGPLASGTRRLILATLKVVLRHAVETGALGAVPKLPRGRTPKQSDARRRVLSPEEEARLLAYCAPFSWLAPIITVATHEALRLGEVLALQWEDVDFAQNKLHVRHSLDRARNLGPTKGGKAATIELTPLAREALLELRGEAASGYVFRNGEGRPRHLHDVQRAFRKARERAALPVTDDGPVVFHSLRHTGGQPARQPPGDPARACTRLRPPRRPRDHAGLRAQDRGRQGHGGDRGGAGRVGTRYPTGTTAPPE